MDFDKLCMAFAMHEPFYGIVLSSMKKIPDKRLPTLGVFRSGNVFALHYNPDFINSLPEYQVIGVLKHEVLHVCFHHFWHEQELEKTEKVDSKTHNIACDMEVNSYIDKNILPEGCVFCEDYGLDSKQGTLYYYRCLMNQQNQQKAQAQNPQQPCNGGMGGLQGNQSNPKSNQSNPNTQNNTPQQQNQDTEKEKEYSSSNQQVNNPGSTATESGSSSSDTSSQQVKIGDKVLSTLDDHSHWPSDMSKEESELVSSEIDDMLAFAAEEVEKSQGTVPGEMRSYIEKIRKKPKPVTDWRRYCRRYLGNEFTEIHRKSKKRESKRFPDAAGTRHQRKSHVLVAVDTSGSVSMPEYREFFGQIKTLSDKASFHVLECDAQIQHEYDFKGKIHEDVHGGGGTSFEPVITYFINNKKKYDCLVYFTDGYCNIPKNTPKDTLWIISSKGDQSNRKRYRVNGASVVFIPNKISK